MRRLRRLVMRKKVTLGDEIQELIDQQSFDDKGFRKNGKDKKDNQVHVIICKDAHEKGILIQVMREDFTYLGLLNDADMSSKFEVVYQEIIQMKFVFLFVFDATRMDEEIRIQLSLRFWTDTGWVCKDGEATGFVVAWESGDKCVWKCFSKNMYSKVLSLNAYINHLQLVSMGLTKEIGS
ncbi:hypothetical protein HanRHA438_Chr05g0216361 [Helianthus annuus]|nr:hypothetical protein HanRHA438_Chr05g0216361 [Helianthus annuus]